MSSLCLLAYGNSNVTALCHEKNLNQSTQFCEFGSSRYVTSDVYKSRSIADTCVECTCSISLSELAFLIADSASISSLIGGSDLILGIGLHLCGNLVTHGSVMIFSTIALCRS